MNNYCCNCGKKINENFEYCPSCGNKINKSESSGELINTKNVKKEDNSNGVIAFILSIIAYFSSGFAGAESLMDLIVIYIIYCIIFSIYSIVKASENNQKKGFAITGLIISIISILLFCYNLYKIY